MKGRKIQPGDRFEGKVIHVEDTLYDRVNNEDLQVEELRFDGLWEIRTELGYIMPSWFVPVHADSLERIAEDIERAEKWCDKDGSYGTVASSVSKSTLHTWATRIRKLAKEEDE